MLGEEQREERETTRTTRVIEVEFHSPVRFEKMSKAKETPAAESEEKAVEENQGFIMKSESPEIAQPMATEKYTVQKNDTLQKISQKFFGTTKKWTKIYELNKDVLKGPNKLYPGQVINIPVESLKEPKENLK
jgi:nucleoid-associated protein YgaU